MPATELDHAIEPLPEGLVDALLRVSGFPRDADAERGIEHIQTHLSHVLLLEHRVYKLRKSVDLGFVSFAARSRRNADCLNEVRLNRRLAPSVYLGVAPVVPSENQTEKAGFEVGELMPDPEALDPALEHVVVMQRLEPERDALTLLEREQLDARRLDRVAVKIARFHRALPAITRPGAGDVTAPAEANLTAIESAGEEVIEQAAAAALRQAVQKRLAALAPVLERRRLAGRVIEGHGDLHLQHVWFPTAGEGRQEAGQEAEPEGDADPPIIDCLEFSESLRVIDVAAEVAFLAMDLVYRDAGALGEGFLRRYALETDDYDLYSVIDLFISHRAAVRGKVAVLAAADTGIAPAQREGAAESAARHVALASRALEPRTPGDVVLVGGVIGTGKSTVAHALARQTGAVVVSSDRVRKAMLGLAATDRLSADANAAAYTPEARARVYDAMLERAEPVVQSGRPVVLDATWSSREARAAARAFAKALGARCVCVETRCAPGPLRARLEARQARGDDPSDAGPEQLDASIASFEAIGPEVDACAAIDTDAGDLDARIGELPEALDLPTTSIWG